MMRVSVCVVIVASCTYSPLSLERSGDIIAAVPGDPSSGDRDVLELCRPELEVVPGFSAGANLVLYTLEGGDPSITVVVPDGCSASWIIGAPLSCDSSHQPCCTAPSGTTLACDVGEPLQPVVTREIALLVSHEASGDSQTHFHDITFLPTAADHSVFADAGLDPGQGAGTPDEPGSVAAALSQAASWVAISGRTVGVYVRGEAYLAYETLDLSGIFLVGGFAPDWTSTQCGCGGASDGRWDGGAVVDWAPTDCLEHRLELAPSAAISTSLVEFDFGHNTPPSGLQAVFLHSDTVIPVNGALVSIWSHLTATQELGEVLLADVDLSVVGSPATAISVDGAADTQLDLRLRGTGVGVEVVAIPDAGAGVVLGAPLDNLSELERSCIVLDDVDVGTAIRKTNAGDFLVSDSVLVARGSGTAIGIDASSSGASHVLAVESSRVLLDVDGVVQAVTTGRDVAAHLSTSRVHLGSGLANHLGFLGLGAGELHGNLFCAHGDATDYTAVFLDNGPFHVSANTFGQPEVCGLPASVPTAATAIDASNGTVEVVGNLFCSPPGALATTAIRLRQSNGIVEDNIINGPACAANLAALEDADSSVAMELRDASSLSIARNVIITLPLANNGERAFLLEDPIGGAVGFPRILSNAIAVNEVVFSSQGSTPTEQIVELGFNTILASSPGWTLSNVNDIERTIGLDNLVWGPHDVHDNVILLKGLLQDEVVSDWPWGFANNTFVIGALQATAVSSNNNELVAGSPYLCAPLSRWLFDPHLSIGPSRDELKPVLTSGSYPLDLDQDARTDDSHRGADAMPNGCGGGPLVPPVP